MVKKLAAIALFLVVALPNIASAATFDGGEQYALRSGETVSGNLYVGAGDLTIAGSVLGDALGAGGSIVVSGNVRDDAELAGGNVTVLGNVGGDARIAGGNLVIESAVGGDLVAAGGTIKVLDTTTVGGDMVLAGGAITFTGDARGNARFAGDQITIEGRIRGDVIVDTNGKLILGKNARIDGTLTYRGVHENALEARDGSVVSGGITFESRTTPMGKAGVGRGFLAVLGTLLLIKLIAMIITGIIAVMVFRSFSQTIVDDALERPWMNILRGFIALIVTPIAAIILLVTIFGGMIGLFVLGAFILSIMIAALYAGIIFGGCLYKSIQKKNPTIRWQHAVIGIILLALIRLIPIVGWIICLGFFLLSFGALLGVMHKKLWLKR